MDKSIVRQYRRGRIHLRVRKKVLGTPDRPRVAVYRSNKHFYAQAIDDLKGITLASVSTLEKEFKDAFPALEKEYIEKVTKKGKSQEKALKQEKPEKKVEKKGQDKKGAEKPEKSEKAEKPEEKLQQIGKSVLTAILLGKYMARKVAAKGIKHVVFDRGGFLYHGRVKAFADGARDAGLDF